MSGWEKYVEQAAEPLDPAAFDRTDPQHDHWALDFRRGVARDQVRKILAAVGPLIEEDTRDRMVTAAEAAVEREGAPEWVATVVPCSACRARESGEAKATLPNRHGATVEIDLDDIPLETDRQYAFNGDEADEVWVDRP